MKKIFTLITTVLIAVTAWADTPEFLFQGKETNDTTTYEAPYKVDDLGVIKIYELQSCLSLKGIIGKEVTLSVTADSIISVCSLTGQCVNSTSDKRTAVLSKEGAESVVGDTVTVDLEIHGVSEMAYDDSFDPAKNLRTITVEAKVWYTDSPEEVATVKVLMTNKSADELAGIADVASDSTSDITFISGNVLNYNVASPTKLEIYTTAGSLVLSRKIAAVGSISLDALAPGVYIYKAANKSGKILVR